LLEPGTRSHVNNSGDWHIDSDPRVFILSSPCSALTEFNVNPLEIESEGDETLLGIVNRISRNTKEFGVVGRKLDPFPVYTFENHLHRAVDPKGIEIRFFLRVKETDEPAYERAPKKHIDLRTVGGTKRIHIEYGHEKVSIYFPQSMKPKMD